MIEDISRTPLGLRTDVGRGPVASAESDPGLASLRGRDPFDEHLAVVRADVSGQRPRPGCAFEDAHVTTKKPGPRNTEGHLGIPRAASAERLRTMETIRGTARGRLPPGLRSDRADKGRQTCGYRPGRGQRDRQRTIERITRNVHARDLRTCLHGGEVAVSRRSGQERHSSYSPRFRTAQGS
jgi:hypothetical protein